MTDARWTRIEQLFDQAADLPADGPAGAARSRVRRRSLPTRDDVLALLAHDRSGSERIAAVVEAAAQLPASRRAQARRRTLRALPRRPRAGPRRHGRGVRGRARRRRLRQAGRPQGGGRRRVFARVPAPLPRRAPDPGAARAPAHRPAARRRHERRRRPLLRDGVRRGRPDHRLRRRPPARRRRAPAAVPPGLRRRRIRAPEPGDPPRPEARQHPGRRRLGASCSTSASRS